MASSSTALLVQYIVLRRDLLASLKWPIGALVAQGCHACTAVLHVYSHDSLVQEYLSAIDSMHKVVLEVKSEDELKLLSSTLSNEGIDHKLWTEQPENIPTCLATKPYHKNEIQKYFKKLKLFS